MYYIIRVVILAAIAAVSMLGIKKLKGYERRRRILGTLISLSVLLFMLIAVPVEDFITTFSSVEKANSYINLGSEIDLIVNGDKSDLIVTSGNKFRMFPKSEKGWRLGSPFNQSKIIEKRVDDIKITILYQKEAQEHFAIVEISDAAATDGTVSDSANSDFIYRIADNKTGVYYACIKDFNSNYRISINGRKIPAGF